MQRRTLRHPPVRHHHPRTAILPPRPFRTHQPRRPPHPLVKIPHVHRVAGTRLAAIIRRLPRQLHLPALALRLHPCRLVQAPRRKAERAPCPHPFARADAPPVQRMEQRIPPRLPRLPRSHAPHLQLPEHPPEHPPHLPHLRKPIRRQLLPFRALLPPCPPRAAHPHLPAMQVKRRPVHPHRSPGQYPFHPNI